MYLIYRMPFSAKFALAKKNTQPNIIRLQYYSVNSFGNLIEELSNTDHYPNKLWEEIAPY